MDLMLWASERGQMLSRTVKGMMMYAAALRQLELLEASDASLPRTSPAADGKFTCALSFMIKLLPLGCECCCVTVRKHGCLLFLTQRCDWGEWVRQGPSHADHDCGAPCRHIVSSQVYGSKKASSKPADKWLALSVDYLMQKYPALRIAYIGTVRSVAAGGKGTPMSVLLRWNAEKEQVEECFRVRLPDQREDGRGVVRFSSAFL